ncbi:MAG: hypothetical protein AAGB31_11770 [Bdellovibrio sp.]
MLEKLLLITLTALIRVLVYEAETRMKKHVKKMEKDLEQGRADETNAKRYADAQTRHERASAMLDLLNRRMPTQSVSEENVRSGPEK